MKHSRWVNFYPPTDGFGPRRWATTSWNTRPWADQNAKPGRLACIHVEFEEGEGIRQCKMTIMDQNSVQELEAECLSQRATIDRLQRALKPFADCKNGLILNPSPQDWANAASSLTLHKPDKPHET